MKSILGEILMGAMMVHAGVDPEKMAEQCTDKIMEALEAKASEDAENASESHEENMGRWEAHKRFAADAKDAGTFRLSIERAANDSNVHASAVGNGKDVFNGIANLLEIVAAILSDRRATEAAMIAGGIGEMVRKEILLEGISNGTDCVKKTED